MYKRFSGSRPTRWDIEKLLPGAIVLKGLAIRGSKAQSDAEGTGADVAAWLEKIGPIQ